MSWDFDPTAWHQHKNKNEKHKPQLRLFWFSSN